VLLERQKIPANICIHDFQARLPYYQAHGVPWQTLETLPLRVSYRLIEHRLFSNLACERKSANGVQCNKPIEAEYCQHKQDKGA